MLLYWSTFRERARPASMTTSPNPKPLPSRFGTICVYMDLISLSSLVRRRRATPRFPYIVLLLGLIQLLCSLQVEEDGDEAEQEEDGDGDEQQEQEDGDGEEQQEPSAVRRSKRSAKKPVKKEQIPK